MPDPRMHVRCIEKRTLLVSKDPKTYNKVVVINRWHTPFPNATEIFTFARKHKGTLTEAGSSEERVRAEILGSGLDVTIYTKDGLKHLCQCVQHSASEHDIVNKLKLPEQEVTVGDTSYAFFTGDGAFIREFTSIKFAQMAQLAEMLHGSERNLETHVVIGVETSSLPSEWSSDDWISQEILLKTCRFILRHMLIIDVSDNQGNEVQSSVALGFEIKVIDRKEINAGHLRATRLN